MSSETVKLRTERLLSLGICSVCGKYPINYSRSKRYCTFCLDKRLKKQKEYYLVNKKNIQRYQKSWVENNKEHCLSKKKERYQKHKEEILHDNHLRLYKRRHSTGKHTLKEWKSLLVSCGNKCLQCGNTENLERDHVVPVSQGGTSDISNIQPLCKSCNRSKWNKIIDFRPFGSWILEWT